MVDTQDRAGGIVLPVSRTFGAASMTRVPGLLCEAPWWVLKGLDARRLTRGGHSV